MSSTPQPRRIETSSTHLSVQSSRHRRPEQGPEVWILHDIRQAQRDIARVRDDMDGLARQLNGMTTDLTTSKNRVAEIEVDLTDAEEDHVALQVLLKRAVVKQKQVDVHAARMMKRIHSSLTTVIDENQKLQDRLVTIASSQAEHQGSLSYVDAKLRDYVLLLHQAQDAIRSLQRLQLRCHDTLTVRTTRDRWHHRKRSSRHEQSLVGDPGEVAALVIARSPCSPSSQALTWTRSTTSAKSGSMSLYTHRVSQKRVLACSALTAKQPLPQGLRLLLYDS